MQNTAEKIEDFSSRGLNFFKRYMYTEAVEFWDSALQENAQDYGQIQEIKEAKNWFLNLQIDKKKKERIINQLNTLLEHYHVEFIGSFRNKDKKKLTPVADILINEKDKFLIIDEFNHRVQIYDREGKVISSFGKKGKESGQFYYPKALAQDSKGNLYVADCWNHRIQKFSPEFEFLTAFGSYGEKEGEFNEPYDIAIDQKDRLFITDKCNHRIQVFDSDGKILYSFGQRGTILEEELAEFYETPKELFSIPAFEFPTKIALDTKENLYIADSGNCRILILTPSGEFLSSFGEKGEGKGRFQYPFDIAVDTNDNIFISDPISNRINKYTPEGLFVLSLKGIETDDNSNDTSLFTSPSVITFDKKDRLIISEDLSTEVKIIEMSHKPTEEIYREKLLLVPNNAAAHHSLANFYCKENLWNEAAEEYAKTLGCDKENLDIKLKLARCLLKSDYSESHLDYLDLIIDFSDQNTEILETEVLNLCEEKYQFEKESLPRQWKHEWEILVNRKDDQEIELDFESKNRKINRAVREKSMKYNKLNSKKKEYISLLFQLCQQENFTKKKGTLNKNTVVFLKKALNSLLGELDQKSHFSFYIIFDIKKDLIRHVYEFIRRPDFRVDKKDLAEYFINIYLDQNKHLLELLRERQKIYIKVEKELNFSEDSKVNYNSFIHLKRLHHKLNGLTYSISFRRARIVEIISIFKNKILKEFIIFTKKSLQSFLPTIEEINWLVWEDPRFFINRTEDYIIDDYDRLVFSIQDRLIEKKKNIKRDYLDKAVDILDKILVFSQSDNFSLSSFMNYIEKEIEALNIISENYEGRHNDYIEKNAQLEHQIRNKKNLSQDQMVSLRNILVVTRLNKQLTGLYLWQSEKIKIFLWKKIIKIIENYQDSKNSIKELLELENWINNLWQRSFEKQDKYKNEILENLQKNSYNSPVLDLYKNDLVRQNSLFEYCFRKTHQVFLTLRNQINKNILRKLIEKCEEIVEKRKFHGDLELIKKSFSLQKIYTSLDETKITEEFLKIVKKNNNKYFIEYDMSFGKLGTVQGDFYYPSIIAKDKDGNLLISDQFNHRIQKFTIDGQFISSFGTYGTSDENLLYPIGLAVDKEGFIYVSNMVGHCIKKISSTGEFVLSFGKYGFGEGELFWPAYLAVDFDQNVYVSDRLSNRIQKFSSQGEFLTSFNKTNKDVNTLFDPVGIFIEKNRDILVGEPLRGQVKKISPKGKCLSTMRRPGIREQDFNSPLCFTQDLNEDIYISDFMNHRIQKFTKDFEFIWTLGTYGNGEGEFNGPLGILLVDKYLFVCDQLNHRIQRFKISS